MEYTIKIGGSGTRQDLIDSLQLVLSAVVKFDGDHYYHEDATLFVDINEE